MKLSNTLGATTLALGLAAAGCNAENAESPQKEEVGQLSADKAADMQKAAATNAAPSAAPTVAQAPAPAPAPQTIEAGAHAVPEGKKIELSNPEAREAFNALCEKYDGRIKPFVREGKRVYALCLEGNTRIVEILDNCEDTGAASNLTKSYCSEDKAGNTHYNAVHATLKNQEGTGPLVLTTSVASNAQNTDASNDFWAHMPWADATKAGNIVGLPFTKDAEFMLAYPSNGNSTVATTPKKPTQPKKPQPKAVVEQEKGNKDAEQDKRLAALEAEGAKVRQDVDKLQGRVGKLEDWAKDVKPSEDKPDLNAAADRRAQGVN